VINRRIMSDISTQKLVSQKFRLNVKVDPTFHHASFTNNRILERNSC
jgi:hypothetical protein